MGMNRHGVVATVLNRPGTLGPAAGKRSRGELPLIALDHATAERAAAAITELDAAAWRGFNMVLADRSGAIFVRGVGHGRPRAERLSAGVWMVTAHDPNDMDSPRTARHLSRLEAAEPERPDAWTAWLPVLTDRSGASAEQINVVARAGFGTVCSSFVSLPAEGQAIWRFAAGPPDKTAFTPVFCPWDAAAIPAPLP